MKTILSIESEIKDLVFIAESIRASQSKATPKEFKKNKNQIQSLLKKISFLTTCKMYLETSPSEEFVRAEKSRVSNRITLLTNSYKPSNEGNDKCLLSDYLKQSRVPELRVQLRTLNFLLAV